MKRSPPEPPSSPSSSVPDGGVDREWDPFGSEETTKLVAYIQEEVKVAVKGTMTPTVCLFKAKCTRCA